MSVRSRIGSLRRRWRAISGRRNREIATELMADARLLLGGKFNEDARFSRFAAMVEIQQKIDEIQRKLPSPDPELTALGAELSMKLRRWRDAVSRWQGIVRLGKSPSSFVGQSAIASAEVGNFRDATRFAAQVPSDRRVQGWVRVKADRWASEYLTQQGHAARASGDGDRAESLLGAALSLKGRSRADIALLLPALDAIAEFRGGGAIQSASPLGEVSHHPTPLFVSGFLYSGSGAVFDYLKDDPEISTSLGQGELGCFFGSYGPYKLLNQGRATRIREAANFVSWSLLGVLPPYGSAPAAPKGALSDALKEHDRLNSLIDFGMSFLDEIGSLGDGEEQSLRSALLRLNQSIFSLCDTSAKYTVINNSLRPYQLDLLDVMPECRYIAVVRDPRDQFVAQSLESPIPINLGSFIDQTKERYDIFFDYLKNGRYRGRIVMIKFEDFVEDSEVRSSLKDRLGLGVEFSENVNGNGINSFFDAEASRKNIGIYRQWSSSDDIARIDSEMAEHVERISSLSSFSDRY